MAEFDTPVFSPESPLLVDEDAFSYEFSRLGNLGPDKENGAVSPLPAAELSLRLKRGDGEASVLWPFQFDPGRTYTGAFTDASGETTRGPMMCAGAALLTCETKGFTAVVVPTHEPRGALLLVLPHPDRDFLELEHTMTGPRFAQLLTFLKLWETDLELPRLALRGIRCGDGVESKASLVWNEKGQGPPTIAADALHGYSDFGGKVVKFRAHRPFWMIALAAGSGIPWLVARVNAPFAAASQPLPPRPAEAINPAPVLGGAALFGLACEEAARDGVLEEKEKELLLRLSRFLGISLDEGQLRLARAMEDYVAGKLGPARRFSPAEFYKETLRLAFADGQVSAEEEKLLQALKTLFKMKDSDHQAILADLQKSRGEAS